MRMLDLTLAVAGIVVMLPVFLVVPLLIVLEDGGAVFFRQPRLGRGRKEFQVLKFRTMSDGAVTRVGRLLRTTGLDEIPQFLNVLAGDMSMVGPRPLTIQDVRRIGWEDGRFDDRWSVLPGITGLAQIYGGHSARVSLFLDRKFIDRNSPVQNVCLVLLSFAMNLLGKGRVRRWLRRRAQDS